VIKYRVELTETACRNADQAYQWLEERSPSVAEQMVQWVA
jgi:hypothetical protein